MQPRVFHLHALSALHCGTGQAADVVDLPIARARATKLPIVPGSSLRGVLRAQVSEQDEGKERALFGPRTVRSDEDSFAGALAVGDAHLLVLPVRCLAGIVSFVTSPFILNRYRRDLQRAGAQAAEVPKPADDAALVPPASVNRSEAKLVLEDLDLKADAGGGADEWAKLIGAALHADDSDAKADFQNRFAIIHDDIMGYLADTATEIRARISIDDETGTVKQGALWYEENLPAETALWGVYALTDSNEPDKPDSEDDLADALDDRLLQLGGNAGVGGGLVRFLPRSLQPGKHPRPLTRKEVPAIPPSLGGAS